MTLALLKAVAPGTPDPNEKQAALAASRALAHFSGHGCVRVEAETDGAPRQTFVLPATAVRLLTDMLVHLSEGRTVFVMPEDAELTTQQAADMLNVSRPHLIKLLTEAALPFHMTGSHRRVALRDLLAYRKKRAEEADAALDELAEQAQVLGLGY